MTGDKKNRCYVSAKVSRKTRGVIEDLVDSGDYMCISELVRKAVEEKLQLIISHQHGVSYITLPVSENMNADLTRLAQTGHYLHVEDVIRHAIESEIVKYDSKDVVG